MKILILLFFAAILILGSCKVGRYIIYNFADINDHKKFHSRELKGSKSPFYFHQSPKPVGLSHITNSKGEQVSFEKHLEDNNTVAFLVIRNDSLLYERY